MLAELRTKISYVPHPFPEDYRSRDEAWGSLSLAYLDATGRLTTVLNVEWDMSGFAEWFVSNRTALCHETLSIDSRRPAPNESIAAAVRRLEQHDLSQDGDAEDHFIDALYDYRQRHNLWFALRGTDIHEYFIGCNHGVGEISKSDERGDWFLRFDMTLFLDTVVSALRRFLAELPTSAISSNLDSRRSRLLALLGMSENACCE